MLGEDEDRLEEIAMQMDPEDGRLCVIDLEDDVSTTVFTAFGIETSSSCSMNTNLTRRPSSSARSSQT